MGYVVKDVGLVNVRKDTFQIVTPVRAAEIEAERFKKRGKLEGELAVMQAESERIGSLRNPSAVEQQKWAELEVSMPQKVQEIELLRLPGTEKRTGIGIIAYAERSPDPRRPGFWYAEFTLFYNKHVARTVSGGASTASVLVQHGASVPAVPDVRKEMEAALFAAVWRLPGPVFVPLPGAISGLSVAEWDFTRRTFIGRAVHGSFCFRDIEDVTARRDLLANQPFFDPAEFVSIQQLVAATFAARSRTAVKYVYLVRKYFVVR